MQRTQRASKKTGPAEVVADPVESAKEAGLRYVYDDQPGIARVRRGKSFRYVSSDGS